MKDATFAEVKETMKDNPAVLRTYAGRVVLHGEILDPSEEADQAACMSQFLTTGETFQLTHKEMVDLVLEGLFHQKRECGCHSCRTRQEA
jgi:hypothetical protein